ncbi:MAG: energy-coupling factor transporter ATPase [Clostridia bacterium]|nr:energy-coupling factor transporter ATPase [Clostridia bacterium]MBQ3077954.1 energy-coupling factor transporter ATPase [Clostridia bacterium]
MLETIELTFSYPGEQRQVLKGVTLTVERGSFVAVLGHNGSGKSTLAKQFNAVLLPSTGKVLADGMDTTEESLLFDIRQRVGLCFQNPDNQIVATIVEEDVAFAPENLNIPQAETAERVEYALKAVGMWDFREHSAHQLSGGQKQRVAIAGIIAMRPRCIVLDEPTAMLDPQGRQEVLATIRHLNREEGITVVMITHYMKEAAMADRIVVMDDGLVVLDGTPREVFQQAGYLEEIGLEAPQATSLIARLRKTCPALRADVLDEQEAAEAIAAVLREVKG